MYPENIEELLKKKYAEAQVDIDHDALWTRVYPRIKKDRKRPFVLWFVAAFLVGILVSSLFYFNYMNAEAIVSKDFKEKKIAAVTNKVDKEVVEASGVIKKADHEILKVASNADLEKVSKKLVVSKESEALESEVLKPFKNRSQALANQTHVEAILLSKNQPKNLTLSQTKEKNKSDKYPVKSLFVARDNLSSLSLLESKEYKLGITTRALPNMEMPITRVVANTESIQNISDRKFSIDLLFGYGLTSQKLKAINSVGAMTLATREKNEKALDAISMSLTAGLELNSFLKLRSGLFYQMITDRSLNVFNRSELIDANGDVTNSFVEGKELLLTSETKTRYNSYHTIGIPIQLLACKRMGAFNVELGAGLVIAYNTFNEGFIQSEESLEYDLKSDTEQLFQNKLQSSLLMDLGAIYRINNRIGWNTNVQYGYGLSGYNSGSNPISQKYNVIRINTGLRYQF